MTDEERIIADVQAPFDKCPNCGEKPKNKVSFEGRHLHRTKRKAQYCDCGWSCIIPTYHEALVQLGLVGQREK